MIPNEIPLVDLIVQLQGLIKALLELASTMPQYNNTLYNDDKFIALNTIIQVSDEKVNIIASKF